MRHATFRLALIVLCCLVGVTALDVEAYPASSNSTYSINSMNASPQYSTFSAALTAYCTGKSTCGSLGKTTSGQGSGAGYCPDGLAANPTVGGASNYICYQDTPPTASYYASGRIFTNAAVLSCPNGGTLSGSVCNCPGGQTDTGSSCVVNNCPTAGTPIGYNALTAGWTLGPTPGTNDYVGGWGIGIYDGTHCVKDGANMCGATVDPQVGSQACWRAQEPAASGLYRVSCDMAMVANGNACAASGNNPSNPTAPAPACPTGNVGTVNGVPVCLGSMPASGINLPAPEGSGNPRAGTGSEESNSAREPSSGAGGGPDARGGPDVTTGPGGTGTGGNRIPTGGGTGSSPNQGIELPTDYNREATQQSILTELKKNRPIDETGVGDGKSTWTDSTKAMGDSLDATKTTLSQLTLGNSAPNSSSDSRFSSWVGGSGSCSAITFYQWSIDLCNDKGDWIRTFLAFIYGVIALIYVFHRGNDAMQGA